VFIDQVKIKIAAGDGGNGAVAWRREKYISDGGPAGGDGGHGGSIIFVADEGLTTLIDLRYNKILAAKNGENGMGKGMHGKNSPDLVLKVPVGTLVYDQETNLIIADLTENNQRAVIAKGGRGGRGNIHFATPRNTAPELAENGGIGQKREIRVELKVLADVGLVGFPSVGKSTLISVVSAAKPKIAAYHFTTLVPNLGVVRVPDGRSFVMADLPGLIQGAAEGAGLGHQFLRHIERTRVILHVIDMAGSEGRDPYEDYVTINNELGQYRYRLLERPQIVVANKMDMEGALENLERFKEQVGDTVTVVEISAITSQNLDQLLYKTADLLANTPQFPLYDEDEMEQSVVYKFKPEEAPFAIQKDPDTDVYVVTGSRIEKILHQTDFNREASVQRFARQLRQLGVDQALRDLGVEDGDLVRVLDFEFEFKE